MFDKFCDYMYYLLTSPFKRVRKPLNQWHILFRVLGKRFDDAMESLYHAQEQTMLATCEPEMLQVHAGDRKMERYDGEDDEGFRYRIAMQGELYRLGGTDQGILLALKTLGYGTADIRLAKELKGDAGRWAEFYVLIWPDLEQVDRIPFATVKGSVRDWKAVGAKDNYQVIASMGLENVCRDDCRASAMMPCRMEGRTGEGSVHRLGAESSHSTALTASMEKDAWHLDGAYRLDGERRLNAYKETVEMGE